MTYEEALVKHQTLSAEYTALCTTTPKDWAKIEETYHAMRRAEYEVQRLCRVDV